MSAALVEHEDRGNCFLAAIQTQSDLGGRVCHGVATGTGGNVAGMRHWHAWVELRVDGVCMVADFSNGKRILVDRAEFYRVGQIDGRRVLRYSPAEALAQVDRWGHAGPWMPRDEWDRWL